MGGGSRKDRGEGREIKSINNSLRFAVRGARNGPLVKEEYEVEVFVCLFVFLLLLLSLPPGTLQHIYMLM